MVKRTMTASDSNFRNTNSSWQQRSQVYGDSMEGVLFKNFPPALNEHIHRWHLQTIAQCLKQEKPKNLLDVGCGYGRLSAPILEQFPSLKLVGLDISENYAELYRRRAGQPALVASVEDMPDDLGRFDCILAVTVLMYLSKDALLRGVSNLLRHLNENGTLIIIEKHCSGEFFLNPFGVRTLLKRFDRTQVDTGGHCFSDEEIRRVIHRYGGYIFRQKRLPLTTFFILALYLATKIFHPGVARRILDVFFLLDTHLGKFHFPTLHSAYFIKRRKDG